MDHSTGQIPVAIEPAPVQYSHHEREPDTVVVECNTFDEIPGPQLWITPDLSPEVNARAKASVTHLLVITGAVGFVLSIVSFVFLGLEFDKFISAAGLSTAVPLTGGLVRSYARKSPKQKGLRRS